MPERRSEEVVDGRLLEMAEIYRRRLRRGLGREAENQGHGNDESRYEASPVKLYWTVNDRRGQSIFNQAA